MKLTRKMSGTAKHAKGIALFVWLILLGFKGLFAQATVDWVSTDETSGGTAFSYRIVGASFSAVEKLEALEALQSESDMFDSFSYQAESHICTIEVGKLSADMDAKLIQYYLEELVGAPHGLQGNENEEWADDDPRHQLKKPDLQTAIPEPTNPDDMPDWGISVPENQLQNQD